MFKVSVVTYPVSDVTNVALVAIIFLPTFFMLAIPFPSPLSVTVTPVAPLFSKAVILPTALFNAVVSAFLPISVFKFSTAAFTALF